MKARYIRVSTANQSNRRQLQKSFPDEKLYIDVVSGTVPFVQRIEGVKLIMDIKAGLIDYVTFHDISRAGRNTLDVLQTLDNFQKAGVTIKIENLGLESKLPDGKTNPVFGLITTILSEIYMLERESLLERQREGIEAAKKANPDTYKGRVKGTIESDEQVLDKYKAVVKELKLNPSLSLAKIASICNDKLGKEDTKLSPNTVRKVKLILEKRKELV